MFCAAAGPSVKFRQNFLHLLDFPKTFRVAAGVSVNFSQLSVRPHEHLSNFCVSTRFPSTSARHRPALREGLPTPPGTPGGTPNPLGGTPDPFQPSGRTSRLLPFLREGLPTPAGPFWRASQPLPALWEKLSTFPGPRNPSQLSRRATSVPPREPHNPFEPSRRDSRPLPALPTPPGSLKGLPTPPVPPGRPLNSSLCF